MNQPITVDFESEPIIGNEYKLKGVIGDFSEGETVVLVDITHTKKQEKLPSGRVETYVDTLAIFEREDGTRFKRVILPPLE